MRPDQHQSLGPRALIPGRIMNPTSYGGASHDLERVHALLENWAHTCMRLCELGLV